ncbi:hypothetical protein DFH29DRAFT_1015702 [Suillus ampliporus]|nr:hypothetical protein DFH29DRAFT_1015702 [Suillus ampliporus]
MARKRQAVNKGDISYLVVSCMSLVKSDGEGHLSFALMPQILRNVIMISGGMPTENAGTFKALLNSGNDILELLTPILHFVLLNASALLVVAGLASDFKEGVALAMNSTTSGNAWDALLVFRNASMEAVKEISEPENGRA